MFVILVLEIYDVDVVSEDDSDVVIAPYNITSLLTEDVGFSGNSSNRVKLSCILLKKIYFLYFKKMLPLVC